MRWQFLAVTALSVFPIIGAATGKSDPASNSKALPPPMVSALQQFAHSAAQGKLPLTPQRRLGVQPSRVCSIPLVEVPYQKSAKAFDGMPSPRGFSLDRNQIAPPAPPCPARK